MDIIPTNTSPFEGLVSKYAVDAKKSALENLAAWLERMDAMLYSMKPYYLKVVRVQRRTVLTTIGLLSFRRRYYQNEMDGGYVCLLDSVIKIPRRVKVLDEVKYQAIRAACEMSYEKAGRYGSEIGYPISKSTVCRAIKKLTLEAVANPALKGNDSVVHLQIDEKFLNMLGSKNKKKLYTATIFKGREEIGAQGKMRLVNRKIMSSTKLKELFSKINRYLATYYKLGSDDTIYVSGDLATYIQNSPERVIVCKAVYVPDKFHIKSPLEKELGLKASDEELNDPSYMDSLIAKIEGDGELMGIEGLSKIAKLYRANNGIFKPYLESSYDGCSQEGMNSHYYSPRFDSVCNKFKPETIEKIASIIEAGENGESMKATIGKKSYYEEPNLQLGGFRSELERYDIDKRSMNPSMREFMNTIEYGDKVY